MMYNHVYNQFKEALYDAAFSVNKVLFEYSFH